MESIERSWNRNARDRIKTARDRPPVPWANTTAVRRITPHRSPRSGSTVQGPDRNRHDFKQPSRLRVEAPEEVAQFGGVDVVA